MNKFSFLLAIFFTGFLSADESVSVFDYDTLISNPGYGVTAMDIVPIKVPEPYYPGRAKSRKIRGAVIFTVTLMPDGTVENPQLVSEYPEGYGFSKSALRAGKRLKYKPIYVNGQAIKVTNVPYRYTYNVF